MLEIKFIIENTTTNASPTISIVLIITVMNIKLNTNFI